MGTLVNNTSILVTDTTSLVNDTNGTVTTLGLLLPQVNALNAHLSELDAKMDAARGNPKLIAQLRAEADEARASRDTVTNQILYTTAPGVYKQMHATGLRWYLENDHLITEGVATHEAGDVMLRKRALLDEQYSNETRPLMATADYLRQQLLKRLPLSDNSDEDKNQAVVFAKVAAGETIDPDTFLRAGGYLNGLYLKVYAKK